MEGYTLRQQPLAALRGPSPLLRLASDERLIELTRAGQQSAFEALVARYQQRLLAFCRHMLRSREDAEDVLQEVFAAAFNAIMADSREINARPWLYRIARNRSLNHMRRATAIGVDSMDLHFADAGQSTSDKAHGREEFRLLVDDISHLPESQRAALVLREMDALSYEQIADVMDTTVPSVKSLLVRARIGLAEAAEARKLTCDEVRFELGEVAEGLRSLSPPVRRHVKGCERCRSFRTQLRSNNRALAAIMPLGPLLLFKKTLLVKFGLAKLWAGGATGGAASAGGGAATAGGAAATGSALAATGGGVGGLAVGTVAIKVVAVAAVATVAAVSGNQIFHHPHRPAPAPAASATALTADAPRPAPFLIHQHPLASGTVTAVTPRAVRHGARALLLPPGARLTSPTVGGLPAVADTGADSALVASPPAVDPVSATTAPPPTPATVAPTTQEISTTTVFPGGGSAGATAGVGATGATGATAAAGPTAATGETITTVTSLSGSTGTTSTTGSTGSVGTVTTTTGATGATGPVANSASVAPAGATGATGATGS